ncbi:MAG: DNA/RNA non-specific endonuclease [Runella slithyformis]|nr:MAG: DNA/RNA non-specific endonuclease [Runella slithyformis]TAF95702.1 MAG: DNA/RNA non-specific endonuclease [Runella sp.]TAG19123.1 MAG: DNA/RNA non-specific endonuclease [Cytophagales bacterium]TAG38406.1 MAG: DNA/RNA non-specific endonuclease [Cytophagia bacterium]TAF25296.1 MAG: DNA/RNA non-specific endonuclease [Runella slithyformis]
MFRKGFRWASNTLFLLFFFFVVGLVLHYKGRTKPLVAFWNDLRSLAIPNNRNANQPNPYKAPEPNVATDEQVATDAKKKPAKDEQSLLDKVGIGNRETDTETAPERTGSNQDFAKTKDFYLPAVGSNDQIVRRSRYALRYREQYEQADWVAYRLTSDEAESYLSRAGNQFKADPLVRTGSATTQDYVRSGYDRGHLAPAGDFNLSAQEKGDTFYMSNISPQEPNFNRGIWNDLEQKFRDWARRDGELFVITGPVLKPNLETIGRDNEIAVPQQYYKIALCLTDKKPRMIGFLMNNERSNELLKTFVVSVDEIEKLTGIDFFARLPDALERQLESRSIVTDWFSKFGN